MVHFCTKGVNGCGSCLVRYTRRLRILSGFDAVAISSLGTTRRARHATVGTHLVTGPAVWGLQGVQVWGPLLPCICRLVSISNIPKAPYSEIFRGPSTILNCLTMKQNKKQTIRQESPKKKTINKKNDDTMKRPKLVQNQIQKSYA